MSSVTPPPQKSRRELLAEENARKAKEAKTTKIILFTIVGLVIAAVAVVAGIALTNMNQHNRAISAAKGQPLTPKYITQDGSFHMLPNGSVDTAWDINKKSDKTRLQIFMDPQCPACGIVDRATHKDIQELNTSGKVDLYFNVVGFLDRMSSDKYSTRAANALITVAENDPEHFEAFITELYKEEVQPKEGPNYKPTGDEKLVEWAKRAGVKAEAADKIPAQHYVGWVTTHTQQQLQRGDLFKEGFGTPSFFVGGSMSEAGIVTGAKRVQFTDGAKLSSELLSAVEKG